MRHDHEINPWPIAIILSLVLWRAIELAVLAVIA